MPAARPREPAAARLSVRWRRCARGPQPLPAAGVPARARRPYLPTRRDVPGAWRAAPRSVPVAGAARRLPHGRGRPRLGPRSGAGFTGLTGRSLGEPDAGLIGFGARLVERAAQLLEPALEQQGPIRAGWRASTRGRYAFSQGKRTIRHYSEMREFAKPGCFGYGVALPAQLPSAARSGGYVM